MSIEKLSDESRVRRERMPHTQIYNEVIWKIKDNDAFRIYCWLQSKTGDWKVIKKVVGKECGVGQEKTKKVFSYFARCGLTETVCVKDEQGKIRSWDLVILNGTKFNENEPFINRKEDLSTKPETTGMVSIRMENHTSGFRDLLNKEILNKDERKKPSCSPSGDRIDETHGFDEFWQAYPKKTARKAALKAWIKNGLSKHADIITTDVIKRKANNWRGKEKQYLPDPATYLNGERWNDEIYANTGGNTHAKRETASERMARHLSESLEREIAAEKAAGINASELGFNPIHPLSRNLDA